MWSRWDVGQLTGLACQGPPSENELDLAELGLLGAGSPLGLCTHAPLVRRGVHQRHPPHLVVPAVVRRL